MTETKRVKDDIVELIKILSFLKEVDLFSEVPANYLTSLAERTEEVLIEEGEVLFNQGEFGDTCYLVMEGAISIRIADFEVKLLGVGEVFGEIALLDGEPRSASAVARGHTRLVSISAESFHSLIMTYPSVAIALMRTLTRRMRTMLAERDRFYTRNPETEAAE